ncbi:MAG TPA: valine--tRNA ligase [Thermoplasmata archaeon]|nr:valine--tRNA ligase [Thermoplasmata archaeon]
MSSSPLPPRFDPKGIEARWQAEWDRHQVSRAPEQPQGIPYSIVLPPPNVTGGLTMGHMLGDTVMDVLIRHYRMSGRPTLWVPGLDHAGLATQVEVRRRLARQGVRFEDLPREEATRELEAWRAEYEARIREQTGAGGFSVDWSRYRYTKDEGSTRATREIFVQLYNEGLIYRGERLVNWDPRFRTAISDLEVVHSEEETILLYVRYPWADGTPGGLEVATVRPETIFGDIAVAVHPGDARYTSAIGREVRVPMTDRRVPVIADEGIDPAFGAGALKVTPRHDPLDYEILQRHTELSMPPEILDDGAHLTGPWVPTAFQGLDVDEARDRATDELERSGLIVRREPYRHTVSRSERSDARIEPRISTQWFVRMRALADRAVAGVRAGEIRIHPERWNLTFFRWMEEIQDWCISRQVLWGHPIPAHRCRRCEHDVVSVEPPTRCPACGSTEFDADPDVLDTWFTSWLWPFLALGWPERTGDLERYYPTNALVTGRDIMFFWVARMMMSGYHFTGQRPFSDVYFTGMVRDEQGRRMSKHLGNSPDPLDVIRAHGADAMRFGLVFPNPTDEDGGFGEGTLENSRNFLTKVWNLARFTVPYVPPGTLPPDSPPRLGAESARENRWILARYRRTIEEVTAAIRAFEPTRAATALHGFVRHDLADRYVEIAKDALLGRRGEPAQREARATLLFVFERTLRLLHPFVPHITEELWHALPHDGELLAAARWPAVDEAPADPEVEVEMETVLEAIRWLRNLRAEERVPAESVPPAWIRPAGPEIGRVLVAERSMIERMARVRPLEFLERGAPAPAGVGSRVVPLGECYVARPSSNLGETEALAREREKLSGLLAKTRARLADDGFLHRAPPEVVRETESKAEELSARIRRIDEHLKADASTSSAP